MAEGVGFEPTLGGYPKHAFQACAFNHSAIPPARPYMDRRYLNDRSPESKRTNDIHFLLPLERMEC